MLGDGVERDKSEFNSAVAYLNRLNTLYTVAAEAAINLDIYMWFHSLLAIYRELSTEMSEQELIENKDVITDLNTNISHYLTQASKGRSAVPPDIYEKVHNFELFLRKIMKDSGLQQKVMDDAMNALR